MYLGSHGFVDHPTKDRKKLRKLLRMKEVEIDPCAVIVKHACSMQEEVGKHHALPRCKTYIIRF